MTEARLNSTTQTHSAKLTVTHTSQSQKCQWKNTSKISLRQKSGMFFNGMRSYGRRDGFDAFYSRNNCTDVIFYKFTMFVLTLIS